MRNKSSVHAFALVSALTAGVSVSDLARADDDKVIHGTACVSATADGATHQYYFDGMDVDGDAVCPLLRDVVGSQISNVLVRAQGASTISCAVGAFAPQGFLTGFDWTSWADSSGANAQTITITGLNALTNFPNGSYIVYCTSPSPFHVFSVKTREP